MADTWDIVDLTVNADNYSDPNAGQGLHNVLVNGLAGGDLLKGFEGDDFIIGGAGDDTMTGGTGGDTFGFKFEYHAATADQTIPGGTHDDSVTILDGPPSTNADWKAWEQYEHRLDSFFSGTASDVGSFEWYKAQPSYHFTAGQLTELNAIETEWKADRGTNALGHGGPSVAMTTLNEVYLSAPKTNNITGQDVSKNHDYDNNRAMGNTVTGHHGDYGFETYHAITITHTVQDGDVVIPGTPEYFTSTDGNDQITDFKLSALDNIFFGVKNGTLTEQQFYDNFTAVKDLDGHGITVSLDGLHSGDPAQWSVHIKFDGVDPQLVNINGHDWGALTQPETEIFVWDTVMEHSLNLSPGAITGGWDTYVNNWIAA